MADETKKADATPTPTQAAAVAASAAAQAPVAASTKHKKVGVGDIVHLVHARRGNVEAEVTKVNKDGSIDLETCEADPFTKHPVSGVACPVVITGSPHDPTGTKHDSWHPIKGD